MATYFEPVLTEEQLAAYLDGMLSPEESNMVEEIIASDPEMEEILETIDSIDSSYINEVDNELPIECLADDFSLPDTDIYNHHEDSGHHEDNDATDDLSDNGYNDMDDDSLDELNNTDYPDGSSMDGHEDIFLDNIFDDLSY